MEGKMDTSKGTGDEAGRACRRHKRGGGFGFGLVVIAFGGLLLMHSLGMLPEGVGVWDFWPLILVGMGLGHLGHGRGVPGVLFGLSLAAVGGVLLLSNLGVLDAGITRYWPVLVIVAGVAILFGGRRHHHGPPVSSDVSSADYIRKSVTFSGAKIRVDSRKFKGGDLSAAMGGFELDLRDADIDGDEAVLDFHVVMGGIDLRIPESWRVVNELQPTLGGLEDKTSGVAVEPRKRLVLRGTAVLGGITIRN
jgi:hypothetical protein